MFVNTFKTTRCKAEFLVAVVSHTRSIVGYGTVSCGEWLTEFSKGCGAFVFRIKTCMEVKTSLSIRPATRRRTAEDLSSIAHGVINANYFHIFSLEAVIFL